MNQKTARPFKYWAFVSYSHLDKAWADWLVPKLETYAIPWRLRGTAGRDGDIPSRLYPVFRDRDELPTAADLNEQISDALKQSACLVVICSPHSAASHYVNEEILAFKKVGRENRILALIVSGEPNASSKVGVDPAFECFPPALLHRINPDGVLDLSRIEPLAADARSQGDGRRNALLKIIAGLLGINYDALKRRDERRRAVRTTMISTILSAGLGAAAYYGWQQIDQGTLAADAVPQTSTITVDSAELGARIRNYPLRTGEHDLRAQAPDHHEIVRRLHIARGEAVSTRFWLEPALDWSRVSPNTQGGSVYFNADSDTILVHNELAAVAFISTATGAELASFATQEGQSRSFQAVELGSQHGRAIISGLDRAQQGPELIAWSASLPPREIWRWQGPATQFYNSAPLSVATATMPDGGARVAAAGRDGAVRLLDGATGQQAGEVRLTPDLTPFSPMLMACGGSGSSIMAFVWTGDKIASAAEPTAGKPLSLVGLDLATGTVKWRREMGTRWQATRLAFPQNGDRQAILWTEDQWQAVDCATGELRSSGPLDGPILGAPTFFSLSDGETALVFQYRDPQLAMIAARLANGEPLWRGPNGLAGYQPRNPGDGALAQTARGDVLVSLGSGLTAVNKTTGAISWHRPLAIISALVADWDGDGRPEIIVRVAGGRILCLDENGKQLWAVALESGDANPWHAIPPPEGGSVSNILVHLHAGMIGLIHGPRLIWRQDARAALRAAPIFAASSSDRPLVISTGNWGDGVGLRAFDARDGNIVWSAKEAFSDNRPAALADLDGHGTLEIVGIGRRPDDGQPQLMTYRMADGLPTRALPIAIPGWFSVTPAIADFRGTGNKDVAINTWDDHSVLLVDGRTGAVVWRFVTGGPNMGGLNVIKGDAASAADVLASSSDGYLYRLHGGDGAVVWKAQLDAVGGMSGNGLSMPISIELGPGLPRAVFAISGTGRLVSVDASTGATRWASEVTGGRGIDGHPTLINVNGRKLLVAPMGRYGVTAFDAITGEQVWRGPQSRSVLATPAMLSTAYRTDGVVLVAAANGEVFLLDPKDGQVLWHRQVTNGVIEADPVIGNILGNRIPDVLIVDHTKSLHVLNGLGNFGSNP